MLNKTGHTSCTHKQYAVSCVEFNALAATAGGCCQMCQTPTAPLVIDHDHALGMWAVRGLLCTSCNVTLGRIEHGRKGMTPAAGRYLDAPWHQAQGWTPAPRQVDWRARVECTVCGRTVGAMRNGAPYPHRAGDGFGPDCTGPTREKKRRLQSRTVEAAAESTVIAAAAVQPSKQADPNLRPIRLSNERMCACGHSGRDHEVTRRCLVPGEFEWGDCLCTSYQPVEAP